MEFSQKYCRHQDRIFVMDGDALEIIKELRELVNHTTLTRGSFRSVHASNYLSVDARFPQDKEAVLKTPDQALAGNIDLKPEWMRGL